MIRVRVTELVYQIGFTTLFRSQGRENILAASSKQQAASSSSKQQQATELISADPHISVSIDGTSPKLLRHIALMMPNKHMKFQVDNHQRAGSVGKKSLENPEKVMKSCPSEALGQALARTGAERGRTTIEPQNQRAIGS